MSINLSHLKSILKLFIFIVTLFFKNVANYKKRIDLNHTQKLYNLRTPMPLE